ncbi:hypothetical protein BA953_17160 [Vibrio coralliilyticus]|uniref:hypothetical protein n=1 Tax=Vibrio coralliilyticus TaxID=190893 RepID=UPI0008104695|nr:hypothetical protein [Vibrio coralliilyticus]ANW25919.1 hypothetical protein BA953_17160 [Vibrio coralliilyticus]
MKISLTETGVSVRVTPFIFQGMVSGQLLLIGCAAGWSKEVKDFMSWQLEGAQKTLQHLETKLINTEMEHTLAVAEVVAFKKPNKIVADFMCKDINGISIRISNIEDDIHWMRNAVKDIEMAIAQS